MVLRLIALVAVAAGSLHAQVPAKKAPPPGNAGWSKSVAPTERGWLGFRTLRNPDDSRFIVEVAEDSPAERAGLRAGDQIIASDVDETSATKAPPLGARSLPASPDGRRLAPTRAYGPVVGRSYNMTLRRGDETFSVSLVAVAAPKGQLLDLLSPLGRTMTPPDSVEARATAYRTELTRTTLQPSKVPLRTGVPLGAGGSGVTRIDSGGGFAVTRVDSAQALIIDGRVLYPARRGTLPATAKLGLRSNAIAGAEFEQLNVALGEYFGGVTEGIFILRVGANSPAAAAGLQPGDVVQSVNGQPVLTITALRDAVTASSGTITLHVLRKGKSVTVPLRKE